MEEQLLRPFVKTGAISMTGGLKVSKHEDEIQDSDILPQFKTGKVTLMMGHAESWLSTKAIEILQALKSEGLIVLTVLDEFQMFLSRHWGSEFR